MLQRAVIVVAAGAIAFGACATVANAAPITYASGAIACTGSYWDLYYPCSKINDGIVDDTVDPPNGYYSYWLGRDGTSNETITIDLGGVYTLSQLDLYNTHNGPYNDRATLDFRVWISAAPQTPTDAPGDVFGTLILDGTLLFYPDPANPNPVQTFTTFLNTPTGRYLTFRADSIPPPHPSFGTTSAGLSELDVHGVAVPEPATTSLLLAGLVCLARKRWRRRSS
jgi:hypothetical protein